MPEISPLSPLTIEPDDRDSVRRLHVRGELDLTGAPALREAIAEGFAQRRDVELDLAAVPFVDSSALRILILATREADELGLSFALMAPLPAQLQRLLSVAGLSGRFATRTDDTAARRTTASDA